MGTTMVSTMRSARGAERGAWVAQPSSRKGETMTCSQTRPEAGRSEVVLRDVTCSLWMDMAGEVRGARGLYTAEVIQDWWHGLSSSVSGNFRRGNDMEESLTVSAIKEPAGASHPPAPSASLPTHEFSMLIIAPRGSGKTTLILNVISNFYKAYFHNIVVFSPTMAGDSKWEVVKKMKGILAKNPHNKELEEKGSVGRKKGPGGGRNGSDDEAEERQRKMKLRDAYRTSWHSLFAQVGQGRETVGGERVQEEREREKEDKEEFTGRIPSENFYTSYDEDTLQGIMSQAMAKIDRFRAKGKTKHQSDRTLLVFDDLVGSNLFSGKRENPFKRLNTTQRHYSISTMMVSQGYKEIVKTVRTNASCLVLFEIPNEAEVEVIYEENSAGYSRDRWMELYRQCTAEPFGFMVINYMKPKGERIWKGFEYSIG